MSHKDFSTLAFATLSVYIFQAIKLIPYHFVNSLPH